MVDMPLLPNLVSILSSITYPVREGERASSKGGGSESRGILCILQVWLALLINEYRC